MSQRRTAATITAFGLAAALGLAACSGGAGASPASTGATAPTSDPASEAPASDAPSAPASAACATSTDAATVDVTIEGFSFDPGTVEAKVGDVIGFTNRDGAPHTATLDDDQCTTDSITGNASAALTFSVPGSFPFHCRIHPDMTGTFEISGAAAADEGY